MWEPRELPRLREDARATARVPTSDMKRETQHQIRQESRVRSGDIPPELLVLVRFGVTYPFIKTAWRLSQTHGIDGGEILVRAKIITKDIWLASQKLLADERRAAQSAQRQRSYLLDQAIHNLWHRLPHYSAAHTWTLAQLIVFNLALITTLILIFLGFESVVYGLFLGVSIFYTAGILLRAFILAWFDNRVRGNNLHLLKLPETLPIYSITVPLYHEANQVHELVEHLKLIDWPEDRLDIKLICEQDDAETIQALSELVLPNSFEIILVPPCNPRTKPKALNYALPLCHGEFLVIYDAEDRPSPGQLREAFATFKTSDPNLACLQAPLVIHNSKQNWLTSMFAIEYNTLFRGILPVLAKWQVPLPLGGTSNHFKVSILKKVGGWDPFNVTEDADLGVRLFREGYRTSTITLPTYEEAPPALWPWIAQRTRWIKGWMQTILVHNRNPGRLFLDLGLKNTLAFHLLLTSIVISALVHPIFLAATLIQLFHLVAGTPASVGHLFFGVSIFNLVAGYTTYGLLAHVALKENGLVKFTGMLIFLPLYWILISLAGWRALFHLLISPHRWEKTPHGLANTEPGIPENSKR